MAISREKEIELILPCSRFLGIERNARFIEKMKEVEVELIVF